MRPLDLAGLRFGSLVALRSAGSDGKYRLWLCVCDCGNESTVRAGNLRSGNTTSCGCEKGSLTHGATRRAHRDPLYAIWNAMKQRCTNPRSQRWHAYGARGITVCEAWLGSFEAFVRDMGPRPSPMHSLDREDNSKGYEPGNCRWALLEQQVRNTRRSVTIEVDGERLVARDWSARLGGDKSLVSARIKRGWSHERAATTPARRAS